ncbi:WYL domain-containing protein [Lacibacter luteus]|uniref:WYL domain-containing protein n=1 Tax=Lacibacter luteus TaxID=2508719 RepID=A0A4Q1CH65_9BACT|nr:WYL domain-containing protein [Lacibacter luteus]RXK59653.1 WYL domain-containing protein [Lacibacter luteus]
MPANKSAAIRYRIIDRCLRNRQHKYPTKEFIRQRCMEELYGDMADDLSVSTIEKDLIAMRDDAGLGYFAPIKYHRLHKGYYYEDETYSIDAVGLNEDESEALRSAAHTLSLFADVPLFENLKEAIEKINTRLSLSANLEDPFINQYVQFEKPVTQNGKDWIKPLYEAIVNRLPVTFTYFNIYKNETRTHELEPYLLKEVRNKWYLIGWTNKHNNFTTYALDRITSMEKGAKAFKYRRAFNADHFYQYSTGIMEGSKPPEKIVLEVFGPAARMLKVSPMHHTQTLIKEGKEKSVIELQVTINEEFIHQMLSICNEMKVVKPASLKKRMKEELQKAIGYY